MEQNESVANAPLAEPHSVDSDVWFRHSVESRVNYFDINSVLMHNNAAL